MVSCGEVWGEYGVHELTFFLEILRTWETIHNEQETCRPVGKNGTIDAVLRLLTRATWAADGLLPVAQRYHKSGKLEL